MNPATGSKPNPQGDFFQYASRPPIRAGWHPALVWSIEPGENKWGGVYRVIFSLQSPFCLGAHITAELPVRATLRNKTGRFLAALGWPFADGLRIRIQELIRKPLYILVQPTNNPHTNKFRVKDFQTIPGV